MAQPSRRQHQRLVCDVAVTVHSFHSGQRLGEARLVDLSLGGGAILTSISLERIAYELRWRWARHNMRLPARLAWTGKRDPKTNLQHYGVSFTLTTRQEGALRAVLDELRMDSRPTDKPSLRDYWNI